MRIVNANYTKYFNKKYKCSGHLWQDRYKSKYITSENYLYSLVKYIENNPPVCTKADKNLAILGAQCVIIVLKLAIGGLP